MQQIVIKARQVFAPVLWLVGFASLFCALIATGCSPKTNDTASGIPNTSSESNPSTQSGPVTAYFEDTADKAGLTYTWPVFGKPPLNILQTIGNGCAFLDYNNDGNLDILLVGDKLALYQGDGKGHFTDVTHQVGLDKLHGHFLGCAVGDYDNDGYEDIYLTAYQGGALLHNNQGKSFTDVTKAAGIDPQPWATSAAFVPLTNSGRLDLYIGNYVKFGPKTDPQLCPNGSLMTACGPRYYETVKGVLYHNLGGGRFSDVTKQWNVRQASGKNFGVAFADYNSSGRQSLALTNDEVAGDLLKNLGSTFTDIGASSGTAYDANGSAHGGMGVDWGDYDNDGKLDLVVCTFQHEAKCVYHNDGNDLFTDQSALLGVADPTAPNVSFGVKWLDFDNDGWLDLIICSGHVQDNINVIDSSTSYQQATQLFHNERGQHFSDVSNGLIGGAGRKIVGRGLAIGDFDNDGKIDVLVVDSAGKPLLLHNIYAAPGHWLEVNLVGTKSNRDGLGALVTVDTGTQRLLRECSTAGSYMSASSKQVHIGLGTSTSIKSLAVHWPSGAVVKYPNIPSDHIVTLSENGKVLSIKPGSPSST